MSLALPTELPAGSKRERVAVAAFVPPPEKDKEEFVVPEGAGDKLGDIENIVFKIGKHNAASEELKQLHRACFGRAGSKNEIKKNLREFSGFVCEDMAAEKAKKPAVD